MNSEYRFERLSNDNIADLVPLYLDAFKENRPVSKIKAKFDTTAFGAKNWAVLAYAADNTVAAFYALFPVTVFANGQKLLAAQVGDLMTHSNHRRKGLYITLAEKTHELALAEGLQVVFTVPYGENASYQGFVNRLGFTNTHLMNGYYFKVPTLPVYSLITKATILKSMYETYIGTIVPVLGKAATGFSHQPAYPSVTREQAFFDYKKSYSGFYLLKAGHTAVWFKIDRGAIKVGDVDLQETDSVQPALNLLKKIAFATGIRIIQFETSPGTTLDNKLKMLATPVQNYRICIKNYSKLADTDFRFTFGDLDNF